MVQDSGARFTKTVQARIQHISSQRWVSVIIILIIIQLGGKVWHHIYGASGVGLSGHCGTASDGWYKIQGPVSLRQSELVYSILTRKDEFLLYLLALSYKNLQGILTRKFTSTFFLVWVPGTSTSISEWVLGYWNSHCRYYRAHSVLNTVWIKWYFYVYQ